MYGIFVPPQVVFAIKCFTACSASMDVSHIGSILVVSFEIRVQMMKIVRKQAFYVLLFSKDASPKCINRVVHCVNYVANCVNRVANWVNRVTNCVNGVTNCVKLLIIVSIASRIASNASRIALNASRIASIASRIASLASRIASILFPPHAYLELWPHAYSARPLTSHNDPTLTSDLMYIQRDLFAAWHHISLKGAPH